MNLREKWPEFVATGWFLGKAPIAPGTFGTLLGIPIAYLVWLLFDYYWPAAVLFVAGFIIFAIWTAGRAEAAIGGKDPGSIVIDEVAGYLITLFALPFSIKAAIAGFFLFRLFDILKPFPAGTLDRRVSGGTGIVADDLAAGIYAHIALRIFLYYF